jgi:large subunit ribosomal protein L9
MSIEVILREHVEHLGRRGDVVKVASGYARNYLLPRKMALAVTEENKRQIARERTRAEAKDVEELQVAQALGDKIAALDLTLARRVGENELLFGSVTSSDLADALAARDVVVDRRKIQLGEAIKTAGEHTVPIRVHRDVTAELKVRIVPAE